MNSHGHSNSNDNCDFWQRERCINASRLRTNAMAIFAWPGLAKLGMNTDNIESESECTEEQKKCARRRVRESKAKAQKR